MAGLATRTDAERAIVRAVGADQAVVSFFVLRSDNSQLECFFLQVSLSRNLTPQDSRPHRPQDPQTPRPHQSQSLDSTQRSS